MEFETELSGLVAVLPTSAQLAEQTENWINEQTDRISTVSFNGELVQNDTSGKRF